ncbi:MAG TPA: MMPL family transporter [Gaiellales bacterium]|nr:MMPL family transporter [Gaiellales bacterium]
MTRNTETASVRPGLTGKSARWCATHRWQTIGVWVAALVAGLAVTAALLTDALTTQGNFTGTPESQRAQDLIEQRLGVKEPIRDVVIVRSATQTVAQPRFRQRVESLQRRLAGLDGVIRVGPTYYQTHDPSLVSANRHTALIPLSMPGSQLNQVDTKIAPVVALVGRSDRQGGFRVLVTGQATLGHDFTKLSESDLQTGEAIGIPIALLILLAVFGTVVAAFVPLLLAIFAIVVALALAAVVGQISPLSFFVVNMLTFMGLAVGIDYSLFIVSRYREERRRGRENLEAIEAAGTTASRAVLFSGMTVVLALVGMLIVPTKIFVSLAVGAILAVLVAVIAALTLLPAVLSLLGDRIESLRLPLFGRLAQASPAEHGGVWGRIVDRVMRRPVIALALSVTVLLVAAVPYTSIHTGSAGLASLPDSSRAKQGFVVLNRDFTVGDVSPTTIVVDGAVATPAARAAYRRLATELGHDHRFGPLQPALYPSKRLAVLRVPVAGDPNSDRALNAVRDLRHTYLPTALRDTGLHAYVGGSSAQNLDYFAITDQYLPIVFALVLGLSFVLLTLAFRSIVVPASSIVMNLLSVGAAYGLLVLVTQQGHGAGIFGFQRVPTVEAWIPLFLFSVLFGLSMDYQVFLLSRIRERYDQRGDAREAVAFGIVSTARLITGAALIMVAVFAGFAAGQLVMFQQMGFGLGVAILVDATVVRTVLMPAWMELLGDRSWYLPRFLDWLPDLRVEAAATVAPSDQPRTPSPTAVG